ncbi:MULTISPECIES: hypothetical protein [Bradyrhizobium]|uniref:hypothetical protein n=1 Tax=Bradyrhizobium TaxID=374 RepID=UPI00191BC164|nr:MULTISPECIES: hypothetical protein [Bradyrhizobium]
MIDGRRQGGGSEWTDAGHFHKTATNLVIARGCEDHLLGAFNLELKVFDLFDKG